jgi:DNA-binding response OmpR family regulator
LHRAFIIAEDGGKARELRSGFNRMGFTCSIVNDSSKFSEELTDQACDVLFVDMNSSSTLAQTESMLEQIRELRRNRRLSVIALVSTEGIGYIVSNWEIDDFVLEPWNLAEVAARANRVIKQTNNVQNRDLIKCGDLVIDIARCEVYIGSRLLSLTFKEYELLKFLAENNGKVFTRGALLNEVWGYDYYGGDRTVDVHIRRLRSKLNDPGNNYIQTVRNIGYRFNGSV